MFWGSGLSSNFTVPGLNITVMDIRIEIFFKWEFVKNDFDLLWIWRVKQAVCKKFDLVLSLFYTGRYFSIPNGAVSWIPRAPSVTL